MRSAALILLALGMLVLSAGVAHADTLWRIGRDDGSHAEFAISGAHGDFNKAFPTDPVYNAGKDQAKKQWPFIHPGPADTWAGGKAHPFTVDFKLKKKPKTACRLMLYVNDTNAGSPPVLSVKINDHELPSLQLPAGAGDASLTNARAGRPFVQAFPFPGNWLHRGKNQVILTVSGGSWLVYDAVALESNVPDEAQVARLNAECTPMFKKVEGVLKQAIRVEVQNVGLEGKGVLRVAGLAGSEQEVSLRVGMQSCFLMVPPFAESGKRSVELTVGKETKSAAFEARVEKPYKLFVAASTHTDIGYTDLQEKCMQLHVNNAMTSMEASKNLPDLKYNLEVFAQTDWIKELRPDAVPLLEQQIREGNMGLTGLYLNMLTGLCSGEEMMWLLRPAQQYGRSLGVPVDMASLNDVPSAVGTLPMFLRAAGIRYFAEAINEDRGPVYSHADPEMIQSPFWWESPDGSRVLAIFTQTYFQVCQVNMQNSVSAMEEALPKFLARFTRKDYPGDAIFINGGFVDNTVMTPHYAEVAAEWNQKWDYPQVVIATTDEYFHYMEQNFGNAIPVYRGDMGVFWEDGAASSAAETAMVRWAKAETSAAEKWQAIEAAHTARPGAGLDAYTAAWKEILYYDEHTWGSAVSISDPNNPQTSGQWQRKAAYADRSLKQGRALAGSGEEALRRLAHAGTGKDGNVLLVSNPFSWERDIAVTLPAGTKGKAVRDKGTGKTVPAQRTADGGLTFVAASVPSMGYRLFSVEEAQEVERAPLLRQCDANTWSTARWWFEVDPKTGGLRSLRDLRSGREWVDAASGFGMNQFLYVAGGNGTAMIHPNAKPCTNLLESTNDAATATLTENGPARAVLHIARTGGACAVDTDLVFHPDGTIDFINTLHKTETLDKEAGYFTFPFALNAPDSARAFLELPYGIVEADTEQMPGACREWYCVNTFAAVSNTTGSACIAAPDAPMFCVGDINRGHWPNRLNGNRHVLYAYVFNNYWHTNYKASQGGDIRCAFSVKLSDAPFEAAAATQFGWGRVLDMTPGRSGAVAVNGCEGAPASSFASLDKGPVLLGELLPTTDGVLARLYNPTGAAADTAVHIPGVKPKAQMATDLIGENGKPLPESGKVTVPARGIATVLLKTR